MREYPVCVVRLLFCRAIILMVFTSSIGSWANTESQPKLAWYKGTTSNVPVSSPEEAVTLTCPSIHVANNYCYWGHIIIQESCVFGRVVDQTTNAPAKIVYAKYSFREQCTDGNNNPVNQFNEGSFEVNAGYGIYQYESQDPCNKGANTAQTANPVQIDRGEKRYHFVDYQGTGSFPLVFDREYLTEVSPLNTGSTTAGASAHWNTRYTQSIDTYITSSVRYAVVAIENGTFSRYQEASSNATSYNLLAGDSGGILEAVWSGSTLTGWVLKRGDGFVEHYGSAGRLITIVNPQGLSQSLTRSYDSNGYLTQLVVQDDQSLETLTIDYINGLVTAVTDSGGNVYNYIWDNKARLKAVIYPDDDSDPDNNFVQVYEYNSTYQNSFSSLVTGIFETTFDEYDANNTSAWKRYSRVEYDALGRVTKSELYNGSGGVEISTFAYNWSNWSYTGTTPSTTVTNARGLDTVYQFQLPSGKNIKNTRNWRITGMTGEDDQTTGCAATSYNTGYDANGFVSTTEDTVGTITKRTRDGKGRITANATGLKMSGTTLQMNGNSQLTKTTSFLGDTNIPMEQVFYGRDTASQGYITYADAPGNGWIKYQTITHAYDTNGRLASRSIKDDLNNVSRVWTYTNNYHADTKIPSKIEVDGPLTGTDDATIYDFDVAGRLESIEDALGHKTTYDNYNTFGMPGTITDVDNSVVTTLAYDARGRVISIIADVGGINAETELDYYPNGLLQKIMQPDNSYIEYFYNSAHQLTGVQSNLYGGACDYIQYEPSVLDGEWTEQRIYGGGTLTSGVCGGGALATKFKREFDALGRLSKVIDGIDGTTAKQVLGYDTNNNLTTQWLKGDSGNTPTHDNKNIAKTFKYDALSRLIGARGFDDCDSGCTLGSYNDIAYTALSASKETTYKYNGQGLVSEVKDAEGHITTYDYNGFGELIEEDSPDRGVTTYAYDEAGRLEQKILAYTTGDEQVICYDRDVLGRLKGIDYQCSGTYAQADIEYAYDDNEQDYGTGRLTGISDLSGTTAYTYDALGRVTAVVNVLDGTPYTTGYAYDAAGNVTQVVYPDDFVVNFGYTNGRLSSVTTGTTPSALLSSLSFEPFGGLKAVTYSNGLSLSLTRDANERLTGTAISGASGILNRTYGYDAYNNISGITDTSHTGRNWGFAYDVQQHLNKVTGPLGYSTADVMDLTYDDVGNRLTRSVHDSLAVLKINEIYDVAGSSNRLESITNTVNSSTREFLYDDRGNIVSESMGSILFTHYYDQQNRLEAVKEGEDATGIYRIAGSYAYNALGQRVNKDVFYPYYQKIHYQYDLDGHLLTESTEQGTVLRRYIYVQGQLVSIVVPDDEDLDGISDSWEMTYFGNLTMADASTDYDGDGILDIQEYFYNSDPEVVIPANGYNWDATADLLLRSTKTGSATGEWKLYLMTAGVGVTSSAVNSTYTSSDWSVQATRDFDEDGDTDVLIRKNTGATTGEWRMLEINDGAVVEDTALAAENGTDWVLKSTADYNGDGTDDILMQNSGSGDWHVFYINNLSVVSDSPVALYTSGYSLEYDGDIDGDGDADVIMRNTSNGTWRLFIINAGYVDEVASDSSASLYVNQDWQIQFVSDFDQDGDDDIVMRNTVASGSNKDWRIFTASSGTITANASIGLYLNQAWNFDHLNDVDADGDEDIILRDTSGNWRMFLVDGLSVPANANIGFYVSTSWQQVSVVDVDGSGTKDVLMTNNAANGWRVFKIEAGTVTANVNPLLSDSTIWTVQDK